jgi:hypothetical protein
MGGWGVKNIHIFGCAFTTKILWRAMTSGGPWQRIVKQEYIKPGFFVD